MCDFCADYYHLDCIGLDISEKEAEEIDSFRCKFCMADGRTSPIYEEGIVEVNTFETKLL